MPLRLFVALDPPAPLRRQLAALAAELRRQAGRAAERLRWVEPGSLHLTLQFLGNAPDERLGDVEAAVTAAASAGRPLALSVRGVGAFPSPRRARVVWAGLHGELEPLGALVRDLGARLAPLGFPPDERPFSPHLTLARARDGASGLAGALAALGAREAGTWRAGELTLFRSHLSPSGPRYEPLLRAPLGAAPSEPHRTDSP
ncbi:MAG: RNA 2',3'-cyclic phosphodiesterase [Deltaproteobacteria bacterium]|nr:RNA 2',3'-cyclic phosphodiesterase [Deltaproteobacteria bacterium]